MSTLRANVALLALITSTSAGCATAVPKPAAASRMQTSAPRPADVAAENAAVAAGLVRALVITLRVQGKEVSLVDARVAAVPAPKGRDAKARAASPRGTVVALRGGAAVATAEVADESLNVEEGGGLVVDPDRTLAVAVPITERVDAIRVQLAPDRAAREFDVSKRIDAYCAESRGDPMCAR